jgi:transposase
MIRIVLTNEDYHALRRRVRTEGAAVRERVTMVGLAAEGWSVPRIARHLGCHEQTVRRYVQAFRDDGLAGLRPRPHPGRPRRITDTDLEAVEQLIDTTERTWTTPQLARWLVAERGVTVHHAHLRALLHRRGFRWKRTKDSVAHKRADPDHVAQAATTLTAFKKSGPGRTD